MTSEIVPVFSGESGIACLAQRERASSAPQRIDEILRADNLALNNQPITDHMHPVAYPGCGCKISENGCIDPSDCQTAHALFRIPIINRWCDQTTSRIRGGGYLLFWSGWARPAAMKLLGRHATVEQLSNLLKRSHPRTVHIKYRFTFVLRECEFMRDVLIDVSSEVGQGTRGKALLRAQNPAQRFGQHTLPAGTPSTLNV